MDPRSWPDFLLGPLLRCVGECDATVWLETTAPCEVEARAGAAGGRERTSTVGGHHYALVVVTGLEPASSTAYDVRLDANPLGRPPAHVPAARALEPVAAGATGGPPAIREVPSPPGGAGGPPIPAATEG